MWTPVEIDSAERSLIQLVVFFTMQIVLIEIKNGFHKITHASESRAD